MNMLFIHLLVSIASFRFFQLGGVRIQIHGPNKLVHQLTLFLRRQQRVFGDDLSRTSLIRRQRVEPEVVLILRKRQLPE